MEFKRIVDDIHDHAILPKITNGIRHEKEEGDLCEKDGKRKNYKVRRLKKEIQVRH